MLNNDILNRNLNEKFNEYRKTKDANLRDEIFLMNEKLVYYVLKEYRGSNNYEDLLQEGRIGLLHAIDNYDPQLGYTFSTYACKCIRGYVYRAMNNFTNLYMPKNIFTKVIKLKKLKNSGKNFSIEEIAQKMDLTIEEIQKLESYILQDDVTSLDFFIHDNEDNNQGFYELFKSNIELPDEIMDKKNITDIISEIIALSTANPIHQKIIKEYFGIGCKSKSYREIGKANNLSCQRIGQIIDAVITKLREPYKEKIIRKKLGVPDDLKNEDIVSYLFYTEEGL